MNDTIIALATPQGSGAIAVIRLSGAHAIEVVDKIFLVRKTRKYYKPIYCVWYN